MVTTAVPYAEIQTIKMDVHGVPELPSPTRIAIVYAQLATSPIPHGVELRIAGQVVDPAE